MILSKQIFAAGKGEDTVNERRIHSTEESQVPERIFGERPFFPP